MVGIGHRQAITERLSQGRGGIPIRDVVKGLTWCRYRILIEGGRFPPSGFDITEMLQKASPGVDTVF